MTLRTRASLAEAREGDFFTGTYTYPAGGGTPEPQAIKVAGVARASTSATNRGNLYAVASLPYFDNSQWSDLSFTYEDAGATLDSDDENLREHTEATQARTEAAQAGARSVPFRGPEGMNAQEFLESLPVGTRFHGDGSNAFQEREIARSGADGRYVMSGRSTRYNFPIWRAHPATSVTVTHLGEVEPLADWERELLASGGANTTPEPEPAPRTAADVLAEMNVGDVFRFNGEYGLRIIISDTQYMVVETGDVFDFTTQATRSEDYIIIRHNQEASE